MRSPPPAPSKRGARKERMPEGSEPRSALPDQTVTDDISRAPVAQLDRVSGYEPEGREFESLRARQSAHVGSHDPCDTSARVFARSRSYGVCPASAPCGRW